MNPPPAEIGARLSPHRDCGTATCRPIMRARSTCRPTRNGASDRIGARSGRRDAARGSPGEKIPCETIGRAGTGTFSIEAASGVYSELQVGSYVFMDTEYARIGGRDGSRYSEFEHSLFVLASVISVPAVDRAILDGGLKSYSGERGPPWVHNRTGLEVTGVSDEHGKVKIAPDAKRPSLGEKLWLARALRSRCQPARQVCRRP